MKNVLKKFLAVLVAALILLVSAPCAFAASDVDSLLYDIWDGEVNVSGCKSAFNGTLTIPSTIEGYPVTRIESDAFYNQSGISAINLPAGLTSIGENAFYGTGYYNKSSNWKNGVLYIDSYLVATQVNSSDKKTLSGACTVQSGTKLIAESAFEDCTGLTSVSLPSGLLYIGEYAFNRCSGLTQVVLPDSVKEIGYSAFTNCSNLTSVKLGNSLASIDEYAFFGCTSLKSVAVPDNVKTIGICAFGYAFNSNYAFVKISGFKLICNKGSAAYNYAVKNGFSWTTPKVKSVSVSDASINYKGDTVLDINVDADAGANYTVSFTSSDTGVVTVDSDGKVYGAKEGKATVTCTVTDAAGNSVSDTCTVKVTYAWWQVLIRIVLLGFLWY